MRAVPACLAATVAVSTATAALAASPPRPAFNFTTSLELRHDDNILQLSRHDLERLRENPSSDRFLVRTADDRITILRAAGRYRTHGLAGRELVLGAGVSAYRYAQNSVKDYQQWDIAATHALWGGDHRAQLSVGVEWTPDYYLRQLTDDDASFEAGRRIRASASYAETHAAVVIQQDLLRNRFELNLGRVFENRNYNAHFSERDSRETTWRGGLRLTPFPAWRAQLALFYESGVVHARGDLPQTMIPDRDVSYRHHAVDAGFTVPWGGRRRGRLELAASRQLREFTTTNRYDVNRYQRHDVRLEYGARVVQPIGAGIELTLDWHRIESDARFPAGIDPGDDLTGFVQNRVGLAIRFRP